MTDVDPAIANMAAYRREEKALERLLLFTDAVIAIVITLMVLEVKPPHIQDEHALVPALLALWHEYLAVGVSFLVIGLFWWLHHCRFRWVTGFDGNLVALNLLFLLAISAIPFVTAVLAKHPQRDATILYAVTVAVAALLLGVVWLYACGRALTSPDLPPRERRIGMLSPFVTAAVFLGSIPVAFWSATAARVSWLLVFALAVGMRLIVSRSD